MRTGWMKVIYLALLIVAALFSVLYLGAFSMILLLIVLIVPVFMLLSVLYIKLNLRVSIETLGSTYHRNTPQPVRLIVNNKGFLPVGKMMAFVTCTSHITGEQVPATLCFPVPGRDVTSVEFTISVPHCGLTSISAKKLIFTDYIRLFAGRVKCHSDATVMILPVGSELEYSLNVPGSNADEESSIYSKMHAGDDPSEVYRIREYQPGDLQKRIHWKLSSRTNTMWVKDYSYPIKQKAAIIVNYMVADSMDSMDTVLEAAYTLSATLIKQNLPVTLYWLCSSTNRLMWNELHSMAELNDSMNTLLSDEPAESSHELITQLSFDPLVRFINAVYFCTPIYEVKQHMELSTVLKQNRLFMLTAESPNIPVNEADNIVLIHETSLDDDLERLKAITEVIQE